LGRGVDCAFAYVEKRDDESLNMSSDLDHWIPHNSGRVLSPVPKKGTLAACKKRHDQFVKRIGPDGRNPVQHISALVYTRYRKSTDPISKSFLAFSLINQKTGGFYAFDLTSKHLTVAAMLRCAAGECAKAMAINEDITNQFVYGHGEKVGEEHQTVCNNRLAYLPLPSRMYKGEGRQPRIGMIRRAIITCYAEGYDELLQSVGDNLLWKNLRNEGENEEAVRICPPEPDDHIVKDYTSPSDSWVSVTPVVFHDYEDKRRYRKKIRTCTDDAKREQMLKYLYDNENAILRDAIVQAGIPEDLAHYAELEWKTTGFLPGCQHVCCYGVPAHLNCYRRYHVKIRWKDKHGEPVYVPGPLCIGSGRFYGLGLFISEQW